MSPTPDPTPVPLPDGLSSPIGTPEGDVSLDKILEAVTNPSLGTGHYFVTPPKTIFGIEYVPSDGLVVTASPWALLAVALATVAVTAVLVIRRHRGDTSRAAWIAAREEEKEAHRARAKAEKEALRRVQAGINVESGDPR